VGQHRSASASRLLDLDGFQLVSAELVGGEWQLTVQTTAMVIGCVGCGVPATPHGRRTARVRDLPIGGRPAVLWWRKRLWRCREPACEVRTWTEQRDAIRWVRRRRAASTGSGGYQHHRRGDPGHDRGLGDGPTRQGGPRVLGPRGPRSSARRKRRPGHESDPHGCNPAGTSPPPALSVPYSG
jgi:zinc-finger of transposase IS204/IS1001/IS1096/IS1165